ncbi:hypothetical protein ZOSMA_217G00030 [Zostera marina]|uniref:FAR1 domain-containing protein n=1 Tax=Zostera marina TaxID=29655 RepID=A0A0K9PJS8_ZOSMR|nr:hypothetical protein ZOSMA_217G00030 [Zostera marina]
MIILQLVVDFSTSLDPDVVASTIFESDFVQCTSVEMRKSSANMSYGTAKTPNSLNFHFNFPQCQTNVNPTAFNVDVSTSLDPDIVGSTIFDSEFVQCTSADIRESSVDIRESFANMSCGTAKTLNNHSKRKSSSPGQYPISPDHENGFSSYSQSNKPCPIVGHVFPSFEMVVQSYYDFASAMGFSVRLGSTKNILDKESGQNILIMKRLLCSKQGSPSLLLPPTNGTKRMNDVSRYGCQESVKFKRIDRSDHWVTDNINFDHNHLLTTSSKNSIPSNKSVNIANL